MLKAESQMVSDGGRKGRWGLRWVTNGEAKSQDPLYTSYIYRPDTVLLPTPASGQTFMNTVCTQQTTTHGNCLSAKHAVNPSENGVEPEQGRKRQTETSMSPSMSIRFARVETRSTCFKQSLAPTLFLVVASLRSLTPSIRNVLKLICFLGSFEVLLRASPMMETQDVAKHKSFQSSRSRVVIQDFEDTCLPSLVVAHVGSMRTRVVRISTYEFMTDNGRGSCRGSGSRGEYLATQTPNETMGCAVVGVAPQGARRCAGAHGDARETQAGVGLRERRTVNVDDGEKGASYPRRVLAHSTKRTVDCAAQWSLATACASSPAPSTPSPPPSLPRHTGPPPPPDKYATRLKEFARTSSTWSSSAEAVLEAQHDVSWRGCLSDASMEHVDVAMIGNTTRRSTAGMGLVCRAGARVHGRNGARHSAVQEVQEALMGITQGPTSNDEVNHRGVHACVDQLSPHLAWRVISRDLSTKYSRFAYSPK
ncbi:hypothetical protein B0H10DRAFT_2254701 [Mycena sp. CBHHK59/15]|nr:hypothetical protein B0H10DRAFT_2254701 [Mycena sp. CBHHK59/15]